MTELQKQTLQDIEIAQSELAMLKIIAVTLVVVQSDIAKIQEDIDRIERRDF